jgi:glycine/D-amino acid oxidase-like deaminating enzyme
VCRASERKRCVAEPAPDRYADDTLDDMPNQHIVVVGGGLAGLSTGCYALANGWDVTILEHNLALGGVHRVAARAVSHGRLHPLAHRRALMSGRQLVQILCERDGRSFVPTRRPQELGIGEPMAELR